MTDIAKAIRIQIAKDGRTRTLISGDLGIPQSTLSNICKGRMNPTMVMVNKIAEGFKMKASDLVVLGEGEQ